MPIQPGSTIVFTKAEIKLRKFHEDLSIAALFTTIFSHVGLRGLVFRVDEDKICFIGPDEVYYTVESSAENLLAIEVVSSLEKAEELGVDDNPPDSRSLLTRIKPKLLAKDIVSVQPMTAPLGALFYLDYTYGTKHEQNKSNNRTSNTQRVGRFLRRTKPGKPYQRACCGYKCSRERKHDNSANSKGNLSTGCVKD